MTQMIRMNSQVPQVSEIPAIPDELESVVHRQLELIGEDPARNGLLRTPHRVAESLRWLTRGYEMDVAEVVNGAVFAEAH